MRRARVDSTEIGIWALTLLTVALLVAAQWFAAGGAAIAGAAVAPPDDASTVNGPTAMRGVAIDTLVAGWW